MAVYVDSPFSTVPNSNWKYKAASHLFADTEAELHEFAQKIGLKRSWFQDHNMLPHYDVTTSMREKAIGLGAVKVTMQQVGERILNIKKMRRDADAAKHGKD